MNLSSEKTFKVVKFLLKAVESSQFEISNNTGVSISYVNTVVNYLADLDIVATKYGKCVLRDQIRLLEKINFDRPIKNLEFASFRLPTIAVKESEEFLVNRFESSNTYYAFTVFSGLRHYYEYHITYPLIHVYVSDLNIINNIEHGEGVIPIIFLNPDRPDIFKESQIIQGTTVCDKIQVVIDLFSSGLGKDAAIKFLRSLRHGNKRNIS